MEKFADIESCTKCSEDKSRHASRYVYETVSIEQNNPTEIFISGIQKTTSFLENNISTANSFTKALQQKASALNKNLSVFYDRLNKDNDPNGLDSFLCSDVWFSWDKKINLRKSLHGNEQIKDVIYNLKNKLIQNTDVLELPKAFPKISPPIEPQKRKIQENIIEKISNTPPTKPLEPQKSENKSWSLHFKKALLKYAIVSVIISICIAYLAPTDFGFVNDIKAIWNGGYIPPLIRKIIVSIAIFFPLLVVNVPMAFISAFFGNRKMKQKYIEDIREYEKELDKYHDELNNYENNQKQKKKEKETIEQEYEEMMIEYRSNLEKLRKEHDVAIKLHSDNVSNIIENRLELWSRLRVCQSCNHVFLIN